MAERIVLGLVRDMATATKIVKAATTAHVAVRNMDRAEKLSECARGKRPSLVIIDWDHCEAEGFRVVKDFRENVDLKSVPVVGFTAFQKRDLIREAQAAGCDRVYTRSEFIRSLNDIFLRYII